VGVTTLSDFGLDNYAALCKQVEYNHNHMGASLNQILSVLTEPAGSLIYHLILVFSIAGALQSAFVHWRSSEFPQARRRGVDGQPDADRPRGRVGIEKASDFKRFRRIADHGTMERRAARAVVDAANDEPAAQRIGGRNRGRRHRRLWWRLLG